MEDFLWWLSGVVQPHTGNGRRFGCPTANVSVDEDAPEGVFVSETFIDGRWRDSVLFIGVPAVDGDERRRAETHVFDIEDCDYYGQEITVRCIAVLRDLRSFPGGPSELVAQIALDLDHARRMHRDRRRTWTGR